jgi:DNA-binding MarR family transcriptional regulator
MQREPFAIDSTRLQRLATGSTRPRFLATGRNRTDHGMLWFFWVTCDAESQRAVWLIGCELRGTDPAARSYLTGQLLTDGVTAMKEGKSSVTKHTEQKPALPSRQQRAVVAMLRATAHVRRFGARVFEQYGATSQQYNVLRILRGAGPGGLPTLDIAERMIDHMPGITRLLDRLEVKKLVRRERPSDDRRQVLCHVTKAGLDLLNKLDAPLKNVASQALQTLNDSELDELVRLLERVRDNKE